LSRAARRAQASVLRRVMRAPFGPWERREITPGMYREALGVDPGPDTSAITHAFVNNLYSVQVSELLTEAGSVVHLWIRRHDESTTRSWSELQRIKDELVGRDRTAVEVFPPADEVVDQANMFHLWVLPAHLRLPFSLKDGRR
jgi:hypothetical protein